MDGAVLTHAAWWFVAGGLMLIGLAGTVLPGLPGIVVLFAGMLLAAWIDHFARIGWPTLMLLGALMVLGLVADALGSVLGARKLGASRQALVGSVIGGLLGPLVGLGLVGLLLGPFIGAVIGELMARRRMADAARVGVGTWLGLIVGTLVKLALAVSMLAVFVTALLL